MSAARHTPPLTAASCHDSFSLDLSILQPHDEQVHTTIFTTLRIQLLLYIDEQDTTLERLVRTRPPQHCSTVAFILHIFFPCTHYALL